MRRRTAHRPALRRHARERLAARQRPTVGLPATPTVPLSDAERRRRLDRLADYLVRTMRACPAPGVAPFTVRDWLLIGAIVGLPSLVVIGLASLVPSR